MDVLFVRLANFAVLGLEVVEVLADDALTGLVTRCWTGDERPIGERDVGGKWVRYLPLFFFFPFS